MASHIGRENLRDFGLAFLVSSLSSWDRVNGGIQVTTKSLRNLTIGIAALAIAAAATFMAIRGLPGSTAKSAPAPVPPKLSLFKDDRQAKAFIADEFKRSPGSFDFKRASAELAAVRVEGQFAICSSTTEASSDQYIQAMKLAEDAPRNRQVLTGIIGQSAGQKLGMSDCDFRVLEIASRASKQ